MSSSKENQTTIVEGSHIKGFLVVFLQFNIGTLFPLMNEKAKGLVLPNPVIVEMNWDEVSLTNNNKRKDLSGIPTSG